MIVDIVALAAMVVAWIATYYLISYAVLLLVGKVFPLVGGRRRR